MSEEVTRNLPDNGSFAARVFARFDAIDARLEKLEARSYDTKPIWERALKAIMETGLEVGEIKTQLGVIDGRVGVIEGKVGVIEGKVGVIESKVESIESEIAGMKAGFQEELVNIRREMKRGIGARLDVTDKLLVENRQDIRDAEERIRDLESKQG
jgi:BMFP domain-containing protein YqiC